MAIAPTVVNYLQRHNAKFAVIPHPRTLSTRETAQATHVPPERLAKAVVLTDQRGYLMAVVPGDRYVELKTLSEKLGRHLEVAAETRIAPVFKDCVPGAIPPIGPAYGMETIVDDSLVGQPQIYFEAGDHEELVQVDGEMFVRLLKEARHGRFSH